MTVYTKPQKDLKKYLDLRAKKHNREVVDANTDSNIQYIRINENTPWSKIDSLAEYGIFSILDWKKDQLTIGISECAKIATGSRYHVDFNEMSFKELKEELDYWQNYATETEKQEADLKDKRANDFVQQIKNNIELGATSYRQAIKWILDSYNLDSSDTMSEFSNYCCYELGLDYKYSKVFLHFCNYYNKAKWSRGRAYI